MKKHMLIKWEKVQAKGHARVVSNFKKKWIPFVLDFTQTNLKKANDMKLASYSKGFLFLSSPSAKRFDEEGFEYSWKTQSGSYPTIDLEKLRVELRKVLKYWRRKDLTDLHSPVILHHTKTISGLYIDHGRFVIKHLLYGADTDPAQRISRSVAWLFMRMLDGLPLNSIRKCKGCRHYFLHTSKQERAYCDSACAGRSIQREKRDKLRKNPRKYKAFLNEQKDRMRKIRWSPEKYQAYLKEQAEKSKPKRKDHKVSRQHWKD